MKHIEFKEIGEEEEVRSCTINTPWLTPRDAAKYLGISDSYFRVISRKIKHAAGLQGKARRFHTADLDAFLRGEKGEL